MKSAFSISLAIIAAAVGVVEGQIGKVCDTPYVSATNAAAPLSFPPPSLPFLLSFSLYTGLRYLPNNHNMPQLA